MSISFGKKQCNSWFYILLRRNLIVHTPPCRHNVRFAFIIKEEEKITLFFKFLVEEESGWTRPREQTWIYVLMYMYCWMLILKSNTMNIVAEDSAALYYCKAHSIRIFATVKWQQHDRRYLFQKKKNLRVFFHLENPSVDLIFGAP